MVDTKSHPQPGRYLSLIASGKRKISFLQWSDAGYSKHSRERGVNQCNQSQWVFACLVFNLVFCCCCSCCCSSCSCWWWYMCGAECTYVNPFFFGVLFCLLKREHMKLGGQRSRGGSGKRQRKGKNMIQIYCIKFQNNHKSIFKKKRKNECIAQIFFLLPFTKTTKGVLLYFLLLFSLCVLIYRYACTYFT